MSNKVAEIVTAQIMDGLKSGNIPWRKPWNVAGCWPRNFVSGHAYSGINQILLAMTNHKHPLYATYKQICGIGGKIRKGAETSIVVFTKRLTIDTNSNSVLDDTIDITGRDGVKRVYLLRYYRVFNIADVENIDTGKYISKYTTAAPGNDNARVLAADAIINCHKPTIKPASNCFYNPTLDYIGMPDISDFDGQLEYYLALFHEFTHYTGSARRLHRFEDFASGIFGSESYSFEELVAEIGANMLANHCGITQSVIENSQAYINGWLKRLADDSRFIIKAASKAQAAFDYTIKPLAGIAPDAIDEIAADNADTNADAGQAENADANTTADAPLPADQAAVPVNNPAAPPSAPDAIDDLIDDFLAILATAGNSSRGK